MTSLQLMLHVLLKYIIDNPPTTQKIFVDELFLPYIENDVENDIKIYSKFPMFKIRNDVVFLVLFRQFNFVFIQINLLFKCIGLISK